ncbi:MmgE/PrpD family protein [Mycobacterium sp. NPDC003449]
MTIEMPAELRGAAMGLARWAVDAVPDRADLDLAKTALIDTVAVGMAGGGHPLTALVAGLPDGARWAAQAHVLDYDDLHLPSTTHISTVCVPAAAATGGDARAYLIGAGVMARLGAALGWKHYSRGWHATSTTAPMAAAAVTAAALGLDAERTAAAIALAVSSAGGVQRAFGSDGKAIQVGLAVDAGIRAAQLAAGGASADLRVLDAWLGLVSEPPFELALDSAEMVPGGLAVKVYPCCYALQRPIACAAELARGVDAADVDRIDVWLTESAVQPLVHHRPTSGLEAKFCLEHALAVGVIDGFAGFDSFSDESVHRPDVARLTREVTIHLAPGGNGLLEDVVRVELSTTDGRTRSGEIDIPPGAPGRPVTRAELAQKVRDCVGDRADAVLSAGWDDIASLLESSVPDRDAS